MQVSKFNSGLKRMFAQSLIGLMGALSLSAPVAHANSDILGAGATFAQPIIDTWLYAFQKAQPLRAEYQAVGSAEGIRRITSRTVDFAVTDIALTQSELVHDDLFQYPLVVSGITPVVNLPGVPTNSLKITPTLLAKIMMGELTEWDDPALKEINPTLSLPSMPILVVHRQEGSGTTFTFTHYLAQVSEEWDKRFGIGSQVMWPIGMSVKGNVGMAMAVKATPGSIGYIEYMYAKQHQLNTPLLQNAAQQFVSPSLRTFEQAARQAQWSRPSFYQSLTNLPGAQSWPIVGVSYLIVHKLQNDLNDARETLKLLNWIYSNGATLAKEQDYWLVDDESVLTRVKAAWAQMRDTKGQLVLKP